MWGSLRLAPRSGLLAEHRPGQWAPQSLLYSTLMWFSVNWWCERLYMRINKCNYHMIPLNTEINDSTQCQFIQSLKHLEVK